MAVIGRKKKKKKKTRTIPHILGICDDQRWKFFEDTAKREKVSNIHGAHSLIYGMHFGTLYLVAVTQSKTCSDRKNNIQASYATFSLQMLSTAIPE